MPSLPVFAVLRSSLAFAFAPSGWAGTLRLAWPALLAYAALTAYEALNPWPEAAGFGTLAAVPWSAFALPFLTAAAMRVRVFGPQATLSFARWLSLSLWVLVWSLLLGFALAIAGLAALMLPVAVLAGLPEPVQVMLLAPLRQSPAAAGGLALAILGVLALGLLLAFVRLYLIVPAAAADCACGVRGAWARGRRNGWPLLALATIVMVLADLAVGAAADQAALAVESGVLNVVLYNGAALVVNQWAAAMWSEAHGRLTGAWGGSARAGRSG